MQFNICFPLCWKWIEAGRRNTSQGIYLFCKQYISGLDSYLTFMVALACPDARYKYLANLVILCSSPKISFLVHTNTFSLSYKYLANVVILFSFTQSRFRFLTSYVENTNNRSVFILSGRNEFTRLWNDRTWILGPIHKHHLMFVLHNFKSIINMVSKNIR